LAAAQPETAFIFGRMHREIEEYLEKSGLAWTHLRPTGFMQEYLREAPSVIHQGALFFALGDVRLNRSTWSMWPRWAFGSCATAGMKAPGCP